MIGLARFFHYGINEYHIIFNIKYFNKRGLNILENFLSDLKAGDRDIFVRRYWYMDNIKDIAKRHGCSETKIKSSLFRSRNKLWEEVKEII